MSIPLVQNNDKDSINTSLNAIKRNLDRINSMLGLVDNQLGELNSFATKQELQDAVTSLQPVDTVASGNLHSVTSNAVFKALHPTVYVITGFDPNYVDINGSHLNCVVMGKICVITGFIKTQTEIPSNAVFSNANAVPQIASKFIRGVMISRGRARDIEVISNGSLKVSNLSLNLEPDWWDVNIVYPCL